VLLFSLAASAGVITVVSSFRIAVDRGE
jgi:hypothetical protein